MKEQRELIVIEDETYVLREALVDSDGDTVWDIKDKQTEQIFLVHSSKRGDIYITFFKGFEITPQCSYDAIHKICEILLKRGSNPTINIHYKNQSLIKLCHAIGFRKSKKVKHLYYLKKLKN